jgi:transposase
MDLRRLLMRHLPDEDPRTKIATADSLLTLVRNVLLSRAPIYGVGEWAARQAPDLLGLTDEQVAHLNDDRLGRALAKLFHHATGKLFLDLTRHVVQEFDVSLDELHNDSTTVTFHGDYESAEQPTFRLPGGKTTVAITHGHNKDHRPDLKQLLYILTVTEDGGVPVYMECQSGNVADDRTHIPTWNLLCELIGSPDFLYVADCKLASIENLQHIHSHGGSFVTVLPRGRKQDRQFRQRLQEAPENVPWETCLEKKDEQSQVIDHVRVCAEQTLCEQGWRLWWYCSSAKRRRDAQARTRASERAHEELLALQDRLASPRSRLRHPGQVLPKVNDILQRHQVAPWLKVEVESEYTDVLGPTTPGRPGPDTQYEVKKVDCRCRLTWSIDAAALAQAAAQDGVFPLVSNASLSAKEALQAYRRQPIIEKRFSNLKTDFSVTPVWLEDVARIEGFLAIYFFVLLVQTLLERELRQAMSRRRLKSLPLYPEGKRCRRPTAHRVINLFAPVQRHVLHRAGEDPEELTTELSELERQILELLGVSSNDYAAG